MDHPGPCRKLEGSIFHLFLKVRLLLPVTTDSYENDDNAESKNLFLRIRETPISKKDLGEIFVRSHEKFVSIYF